MKKKLLILLFVLVLTLSAFSVTAHAVTEIGTIGIENLRAPLAGNRPDYDINYINGNLVSKQIIDDPKLVTGETLVNGIAWYEVQQVNQGSTPNEKVMKKGEAFELGKKYCVKIFVMPNNSNTVFKDSVTAKIYEMNSDTEGMTNYRTGTVTTPTGNTNSQYKVVSVTYECSRKSIVSVEVTGLKIPKAGEYPDNDCNVLTEGVYANGMVTWTHKLGENNYEAWDYDKAFVAGETYKYSLWLRTDFANGYRFRTDANGENIADIMVNGIVIAEDDICDTWDIDYVRGVEHEYYVPFNNITNIDIVGISTPIAGEEPDYEAFPSAAGYDIVNLFWVDDTLKKELIAGGMTYANAVAEAKLVKGDGKVFEEGHEYLVCIEVKPHDNYEINYDPSDFDILYYNATVNGKDAKEGSGCRGDNASFDCNFGLPTMQLIYNVDITGVDAPVAGKVPDYDAVCGADSYDIISMSWTDITQRDDLIAKGSTYVEAEKQARLIKGDGKTFKQGHTYCVNFEVEPRKNYEIDYDPSDFDMLYYAATVNGEDAKESSGYRGENAGFTYTFKHTCAFNLIAKVEATCTDKGKNAYYMCSCGKITEDATGDKPIADIDAWGIIPVDASNHTGGTANCKDKAKCTRCGVAYGSVNKNNHKSLTTLKAVAATCAAEGKTEGKKCTACGVTTVSQKAVAKKAHTLTTLKAVASACTKTGLTEGKKCSVCGVITVKQNVVAKKAHAYKNVTTKATLTKNGKVESKCSACGLVKSTTTVYYPKTIKLSKTAYTYNGKVQTPTVTVKDSKGNTLKKDTDYTVKYESGRKATGKYTVTVTFKGKYSGTKKLTYTIAPKVTSKITATQTTSTITLKWNKVTGADGYRVYQYNTKTKKWDSIKTTTATSYKVQKLKAGTTYKFKIKAYKKDDGTIWGNATAAFTTATKPAVTSKITATQTKTTITLKWSKVTGADGYRVYQYNTKTKKWDSIKTLTGTSYKVEKLKAGTSYKFKIKAYKKVNGTIWGSNSATFETATKPATPKITKLTATKGKVTFTWSNVAGETGYQVYYSTKKDSGYKKVASYKTNVVKGSKSKLTSGKKYYFKVRAYKKTASGTVYSAWSAVKSVKVK